MDRAGRRDRYSYRLTRRPEGPSTADGHRWAWGIGDDRPAVRRPTRRRTCWITGPSLLIGEVGTYSTAVVRATPSRSSERRWIWTDKYRSPITVRHDISRTTVCVWPTTAVRFTRRCDVVGEPRTWKAIEPTSGGIWVVWPLPRADVERHSARFTAVCWFTRDIRGSRPSFDGWACDGLPSCPFSPGRTRSTSSWGACEPRAPARGNV